MLEDETIREKEGREMEILKMASKKFQSDLSDLHAYQDDAVDRPFLVPEVTEGQNDDNS